MARDTALRDLLLRLSALIDVCPEIQELDINPLRVLTQGAVAVDARIRIDYPAPRTSRAAFYTEREMKTVTKRAPGASSGSVADVSAEDRLQGFIDKFEPTHQALIRAVRKALRKRLPTAHELVYDNYNFFVIGYCSTERPSDCIVSLAAGANGVGLSFPYAGVKLPDPHKLLLGSGNQNRFIRVPSVETLARPEVDALIAAAVAQAKTPLRERGKGTLIIRSISAKQRPRRKASP